MSASVPRKKQRSLEQAIQQIRISEADQSDAVSELRDMALVQLSRLDEELSSVTAGVKDRERFPLAILPGDPPRFWVDMTSHVVMHRDQLTYRFLRDTSLGRIVLMETDRVEDVADRITQVLARRTIELEKAKESDLLLAKLGASPELYSRERRRSARRGALGGFLLGLICGAAGLMSYAWFFHVN